MRQITGTIYIILGIWLLAMPLVTQHDTIGWQQIAALIVGAAMLIVGIALYAMKPETAEKNASAVQKAALALGIAAVVLGIAAIGASIGLRISLVVAGLLAACLAWVGMRIPAKPAKTAMYSVDGQKMVEMKKMVADDRGVGVKAVLMGAMPATIYLRPEELWKLLSLVTPEAVVYILKTLLLPAKDKPAEKR